MFLLQSDTAPEVTCTQEDRGGTWRVAFWGGDTSLHSDAARASEAWRWAAWGGRRAMDPLP